MTDKDIKTISEKIDSLHKKILESKFAEKVTESEMVSLILAVQELNRQKAEIEELRKGFTADVDYFASEYDSKIKAEAINELREKCIEHQDFHKGDDGVFRAYISIEDLDNIINDL